MQSINNNERAFLALVRAGLWEKDVRLSAFGDIDFSEVYRLAEDQSVIGLVAAGLEHIVDIKVPQEIVLSFVGNTLQLEQRNVLMNRFIAGLVGKMRDVNIYTLLVKGQGVAQCYERPLWRSCGDVDLLLSPENYPKAKLFLLDLCTTNKPEERYSKHLGLILDSWYVEIHGSLRTGLSSRVDKVIDEVQRDVIYNGNVRSWDNGSIQVFLPSHDNDVYFIFTHFLMHFYRERMILRQLSDLCRLLWTFRERIDSKVLKLRLMQAGLLPEWKAFTALSAKYLGMPTEAIPLYDKNEKKWLNKAESIINYILLGYSSNWAINTWRIAKIFPLKVFQYLPSICLNVNWLKIKERVLGL